jgi:S1-C subfamily serine protease
MKSFHVTLDDGREFVVKANGWTEAVRLALLLIDCQYLTHSDSGIRQITLVDVIEPY